ncbi:MAG: hypothetical protein HWE22_12990 [Flavobacteriales bacterium]|nr:hypothetical protein [Flavobacteriales bacterium]
MPNPNPYISFVVTSRNDNHGGDLRKRMMIFYKGLIHQCNKYQLPCELIMVDWNSPDQNELLDTVLPPVSESDYLSVRYLIVPPEIHDSLRFSEELGLYQMIAKNVGIRRAKAEFICCTNIDLLFSDALFEELAKRQLQHGKFYRANRCDVPATINENDSVEEQLKFCEANIIKRLGKDAQFTLIYDENGLLFNYPIFNPLLKFLNWLKPKLISKEEAQFRVLDTDACGDFTMMSKSDWEKIEGYVEFEMYSLHIDSMALFSAAAQGIEQVIYPQEMCSYHMAHAGGWELGDPVEQLQFYHRKPSLDWWVVEAAGRQIMKEKSNYGVNTVNWGLNNIELKELSGVRSDEKVIS